MAAQTGLGKGLGALIRETSSTRSSADIHTLPIKDIVPNQSQPRRTFTDESLNELAESIKAQGILQPLLVRPMEDGLPGKFEIIAGERRWRASRLAGLMEVPVYVKNLTDQETLAAALVENIQREDLNPLEEAQAIQTLKESFSLSQDDLAQTLGKSRSAIANSLRLLALPVQFHEDIVLGRISAGHARALLSVTDVQAQAALHQMILQEGLSVREAEGVASLWKETGSLVVASQETVVPHAESLTDAVADPLLDVTNGALSSAHADAREPIVAEKRSKPQSQALLEVQSQFCHALGLPVKVTGKENKGKVSISYSSKEELDIILSRLLES